MFKNKNKKIWCSIIALVLLLALGLWGCSDSGSSKKETFPCFEYAPDDETQITGYKDKGSDGTACSKDVVIPDEITSIAEGAFEGKGLISVTFSESVTDIGVNAFKDNALESLDIPNSVTDIGADAFTGNAFTSHIYIPNESAAVDANAFDSTVRVAQEGTDGCFEITNNALSDYSCISQEITIPDGVASIEDGAFEGKMLTSVTFPQTLTNIKANAFKDNDLMDLTLPDSITDIGDNAFSGNSNLAWIHIPDTNVFVGTDAFPNGHSVVIVSACFEFDTTDTSQINDYYDNENDDSNDPACSRDVVIPQGVTVIRDSAFEYKSLTSVIISDSVISIGLSAFQGNSLASVTISSSVTSIGAYAFQSNSLASVTIPNSVTSIGAYAFQNNPLASVTISNSVTSIGNQAFNNNSLTSVIIPDSVTSLGQAVFADNSLNSVTISDNVTTLDVGAFRDNDLTSVTIPDSVTTIEGWAFARNALTSVTIGSGIERIKADAFTGNDDLTDVCIEANSTDVTVKSGAFPAGVTLTYDSDGDCTNN